jgi:hypothetical protein
MLRDWARVARTMSERPDDIDISAWCTPSGLEALRRHRIARADGNFYVRWMRDGADVYAFPKREGLCVLIEPLLPGETYSNRGRYTP